jgi:hypothetical protein
METILTTAVQYAGELIITSVALLVRAIEKKIMIRKKRREWERGNK